MSSSFLSVSLCAPCTGIFLAGTEYFACESFRENLIALRPRLDDNALPLLIFVNKGIEIKTRALTLEIIADTCGAKIAKEATFIVSTTRDIIGV